MAVIVPAEPPANRSGLGNALSCIAAFWAALFLIPYQALAQAMPGQLLAVVLMMTLWAAVLNSAASLVQRRGRLGSWRLDRITMISVLVLTLCTIAGNLGMAASLSLVSPAVTSVVLTLQLVVVALAERLILRTRLSPALLLGSALAVAGLVIMQAPWANVAGERNAVTVGILWALLPVAAFATMLVFTRHVIRRIDPLLVNALRLWLACGVLLLIPGVAATAMAQSWQLWLLAAAAAACGPSISRLLMMYSLRWIPASQSKLISLISPIFALLLGMLIMGMWPGKLELIGGACILLGIALPLWQQRQQRLREAGLLV